MQPGDSLSKFSVLSTSKAISLGIWMCHQWVFSILTIDPLEEPSEAWDYKKKVQKSYTQGSTEKMQLRWTCCIVMLWHYHRFNYVLFLCRVIGWQLTGCHMLCMLVGQTKSVVCSDHHFPLCWVAKGHVSLTSTLDSQSLSSHAVHGSISFKLWHSLKGSLLPLSFP
jgi:hypothetical protein